ncbi:MAG: diaminopimelate decarboxylase [Myxococcota bacterium]
MNQRIQVHELAPWVHELNRLGALERAVMVHDIQRMTDRVATLQEAFPADTLHAIAIKANPLVQVLRRLVQTGVGLEAASWEEVDLARAAGCPGERIVFDGPAKTDDELAAALELGGVINVDHGGELERLKAMGAPKNARIGLRVNPQIGAGSIGFTSTVSRKSKFGVPLSEAAKWVQAYPFITGLHVHTGSQGCGLDLLCAAAEVTGQAVIDLGLDWLDVGGGIPVRYTDRDPEPPSVQAWADGLAQGAAWGRVPLVTEVGRHIHAGAGVTLSRIEAVKDVDGQRMLVVHVGADLLLRRVYRPDDWDHDIVVLAPDGTLKSGAPEPTTIGGPLCFAGDILARDRSLAPAERGDLLLIRDTGAYTLSMWSRHCSRGKPAVYGAENGGLSLLYRGESPSDVVRSWSL